MTPNKPGKLAAILNMVRMIASDPKKTKSTLAKLGYGVTETVVLAVTITDRPGQLAKLATTLGRAKVNIEYMYATAAQMQHEALVAIHLSDLAAGERALRAAGWQ